MEEATPLGEMAGRSGRPTTWKGRSVPRDRLAPADVGLLEAVNRGEFLLNGFRNRDLRAALFAASRGEPRGVEAAIGGVTRLLRCFGPWRDRQGLQDPPLPGIGGRPPQGKRVARSPSGQRGTIAQGRMRERLVDCDRAKKSNVSRTEYTEECREGRALVMRQGGAAE